MRKWVPLLAVSLGTFMLLIDTTIVVVALADIQEDLGSSFTELQWVVEAYALGLAALIVATGSIADRLGHRDVYLAGIVLFAASSLAAGFASDSWTLIIARGVQGVAGAAMFATTLSLLQATYTGRDRGPAFAIWGAVSGASAGLGMVLGGVLTVWIGWRWIFFVNIPITIVTLILTATSVANVKFGKSRIDILGLVLLSTAIGALTFGIIEGGEKGWTDQLTVSAFVIAVVALALFIVAENKVRQPMIPLRLFTIRHFTGSLLGATGQSFAAFGVTPLISLWAQDVLGLSPIETGLTMLPMAAMAFVVSGAMARLLDRLSPAVTIGGSLVGIGIGASLLLLIGEDSSWAATLPGLIIIGIGVGVGSPPLVAVALASVEPQYTGVAAGTVTMGRQLGYALGVAVLGSVFATVAGSSRPADVSDHIDGLQAAWIVAGIVAVVVGIITIIILKKPLPVPSPAATADSKAEADAVAA
ncbi:MFS transporter [Williamsia sp.]|uniref:MFS transporter n=1 Tax=Williamsia sp. TaxID=1872085 RepID=UPI002F95A0C9